MPKPFFPVALLGLLLSSNLQGQVPEPQVAKAYRPLPERAALLAQVRAHQQAIQARVDPYLCIRESTTLSFNAKGETASVWKTEAEVFNVKGVPCARQLSRQGKALPPEEVAQEEAQLQLQVERILGGQLKYPAGRLGFADLPGLLETVDITGYRRESKAGQDLLVVDFRTRSDFKPQSDAQKLISALEGQMVIDEEACQVVRLETRFTRDVKAKVGGQEVIHRVGTSFQLEQAKHHGNTWMPTREVYRNKIRQGREWNTETTHVYRDYRRFELGEIKGEVVKQD